MSEPAVEDLIDLSVSQTDNSSIGLHENPHQLYETSNLGHDFNIDLNKTFDLNKCDEHIKASGGIQTVLEPFNKYAFDCTNQKKNVPGKLSQIESLDRLESDESLGILPDLLNDEMTFDLFKTELGFSDDEIHDGINPEINENSASLIFSPPSDNQFNRISLFLKNISTPLPNFGNDRRYSSTPKISATSRFVANTADIEHYSSPHFLPDEKEEPIAGSCHIKFETDFNLDDLKNVKPLTSTCKTFSPPRLSPILNELGEQTDLKSEVNFKKKHETIENNLNVTQTFSHNVEDLFPCKHEDNNQNVNILNNTFQIEQPVFVEAADAVVSLKGSIPSTMKISQEASNNYSEKEKVLTLDSTFAIPRDEISYNVDCEKTFVIDFNSAISTEVSSKSIYKDKMLNETHVLEMDSTEFSSKQQEQIANVTFTKDLENDTQTSLEHCHSSYGTVFKPMTQILEETFSRNDLKPILEETFSENDLNEMLDRSKNVLQCVNIKSQSASPGTFNIKANVTFSDKVEILPEMKVTQNVNYLIEFASPNSPNVLASNIFHDEAGEKICLHDQINLTESENDSSNKMFSVALQSIRDATFSEEINERIDQEIDKFYKSDSTENVNSIIELASPKVLASTTFNEEVGGKISLYNQIDHTENEYDPANKMSHSDPSQSINNTIFSETNEKSDVVTGEFCERDSIQNESSSELASPLLLKISKSLTFSDRSEVANTLESSVFLESNDLIEKGGPNSQTIFSRNTVYSLNLNQFDNCRAKTNFPKAIDDSIFAGNASEETEFCTRSISERDCPFEILPKSSNTYANTTFSEKTDRLRSDRDSNENDQVQLSQNSLKEMTDATFSEKTGEVQIEPISIQTENDEFETSPNSQNEITNAPFSGLAAKDVMVQPEMQISQCDRDSLGETASSNLIKFCLKGTLSRKATDKFNSSLKSCSLESKTVVKNGLIKPTKIVYPRKVSEQRNGQLPIARPLCKPIIDEKSITSDFNRSLNLCDNSTDKSFSKHFNRRLTISCSSESDASKFKCKNDFKKSFGIPSKLGIKRPESNFQKSRLDTKYSNGHLKDINTINDKLNSLLQPDLISCKDPKKVKSVAVASVNTKGPISSRLNLHGKLPLKSLKMKECGLKSNTALAYTVEKSNSKVISGPKVIDQPRKEKIPDILTNNATSGKNSSRLSIATNLPRKFLSFSNVPNKTCNSKSTVIKQKSAPASSSCKPDSLKPPGSMKLPNSIGKLKFSSLPKVQSRVKISSDGSESKSGINKRLASGNQKSNSFLMKPCIPEGEAVQFVETQSTDHVKQKDNTRENTRPTSSIFPSRERTVQPLNPLICQQTSGKLPQLRRIPAPRYNK
ncbi:hypothetical protein AVEN_243839-2 [Araneus ventricosus]|uniref:Uncharacterized protein n=1 Tax=Araneus ventricosus TaxID=182803 RepID=A0A4Y2A6Q1_ARAVE|nr:hypothetical protein AVEN_243839-2 [Araneus ventricosus]